VSGTLCAGDPQCLALSSQGSMPGKCATGNWELFVLLGEARGSGLALGWCFLRPKSKEPKLGSKELILSAWLRHFRYEWKINARVTHSDKDRSEINALTSVFPGAKHQLCYWHVLRAIKKRLSVLRRQPAFYNATQAVSKFPFISHIFLPIAQRSQLPNHLVCSIRLYLTKRIVTQNLTEKGSRS